MSTNKPYRWLLVPALLLELAGTGCSGEMADDQTLTATTAALHAEAGQRGEADRRNEVEDWLQHNYFPRWEVVETRRNPSGQVVDWVAPTWESAELPSPNDPDPEAPQVEWIADPGLQGPSGAVPVVRPNFEAYIRGVPVRGRRPASVDEFLSLLTPMLPPAVNRLYTGYSMSRSTFGSYHILNMWDLESPESVWDHNLVESNHSCDNASSSVGLATVEFGYDKAEFFYGDTNNHLFSYFTTVGYASHGDYVGGYNMNVAGFVLANNAPFGPGATIVGPWSQTGGTQTESSFITKRHGDGNWWLQYAGVWIGYYPTSNSTTVPSGQRINFGDLNASSCRADWYSEVSDVDGVAPWPATGAGSGQFAATGYQQAAHMTTLTRYTSASGWGFADLVPGDVAVTSGQDARCYTTGVFNYNASNPDINWFYFGGPGANDPGCTPY